MPGRRKKNFNKNFRDVAKQGAMHFEVGHRSQKDPMLADTEASEHVLVPRELATRDREKQWEEQMKYGVYYEDDYDYLQHLREVKEIHDSEMNQLPGFQMKEDYDDDDGAMSVSMASTTASRLTIPSSALGSVVERDTGLLEMHAAESKEDWDPEVLAALDDDFDFEDPGNCLEDDFILKANAEAEPIEEEEDEEDEEEGEETESADEGEEEEEEEGEGVVVKQSDEKVKGVSEWIQRMQLEKRCAGHNGDVDGDDDDDDYEGSDFGSEGMVSGEEDGSEFSMGRQRAQKVSKFSAAMNPRNENLQLIDKMHEELLKREYTEDQVGALDGEQVGGRGTFDGELWKQVERDFYRSQESSTMKEVFNSEERVRPVLPEKFYYVEDKDYSVEEEIDYSQQPLSATDKPEYNVDTIRSTYPKNRFQATQLELPAHLQPEKKTRKGSESMGSEVTSQGSRTSQPPGLTLKDINRQQRMERLADAPSTFRPKDETPEERKDRKRQVKEMKKERREEKSLNKAAYKSEERRQKKQNEARANQKRTIAFHS